MGIQVKKEKKNCTHVWRLKKEGQIGKKPCKMTRNLTDEDRRSWQKLAATFPEQTVAKQ